MGSKWSNTQADSNTSISSAARQKPSIPSQPVRSGEVLMAKRMGLSWRAGGERGTGMRLARSCAAGMALAGLIVAGLGACSGGDDDSSSDTTDAGHGDTTETSAAEDIDLQVFCDGFTAIDKAYFQLPKSSDAVKPSQNTWRSKSSAAEVSEIGRA